LEDETVGKVIHIGLRTSKLKTRDDVILVVPNSKFVNDTIINWSQMDFKTRFSVAVGVAYGSDTRLVTKILLDCATIIKIYLLIPNHLSDLAILAIPRSISRFFLGKVNLFWWKMPKVNSGMPSTMNSGNIMFIFLSRNAISH
jgi:small-conductance mechanosensitive channel